MTTPSKPVVLITGASTGLGLAIAKELLSQDRYHLVLTARKSSLQRFKDNGLASGPNLWIYELDVTNRKQREQVVGDILDKTEKVDFLINNAGVAYRTVVEHIEPYELLRQRSINLYAPPGSDSTCAS